MSKFSDYLASSITPQMTLLEKQNAIIKYLIEEVPEKKYLHKIVISASGAIYNKTEFIFINDDENKMIDNLEQYAQFLATYVNGKVLYYENPPGNNYGLLLSIYSINISNEEIFVNVKVIQASESVSSFVGKVFTASKNSKFVNGNDSFGICSIQEDVSEI